jgi:hypothetical protein
MAYDPSRAPVVGVDFGLTGCMQWVYRSCHNSSDVFGVTGFFAGCGLGGRSSNVVGMQLGDPVTVIATSAALVPGEAVLGWITASTANVTSTLSATGWNAGYDCTIGAINT